METKASTALQAQLDQNNYDDTQLISVKTPVTHLAYYQNSSEFESVAASIEINGVLYKYVKRRIFHDSLEVLCIPDIAAMKFRKAKTDLFLAANGLQHTEQGKKHTASPGASKTLSADYYPAQQMAMKEAVYFIFSKHYTDNFLPVHASHSHAPEHPPKIAGSIA